jgi:thiol-disulfide isomerase/thioredoxin
MSDSRPGQARIWLTLLLGFVIFWCLYLAFFAPRPPQSTRRELLEVGPPVDYSWQLIDLDDKPVSFSQFKGKPIFLNIWATWCPPCVREMPSIAALANNPRLREHGVEFICVAADDSAEKVRRFLEGHEWKMTFLRINEAKIPPVFDAEGLPATFLIDPQGRVRSREIGALDWNDPEVVELLDRLAAIAPETPSEPGKPGG